MQMLVSARYQLTGDNLNDRPAARCKHFEIRVLTSLQVAANIAVFRSGNSSVVEHNLAKVGVASSNLVSRSSIWTTAS